MGDFYVTELHKALAEQHFGIVTCRVDNTICTSQIAFAHIHLLEHRQVRVKLSNAGYTVASESDADSPHTDSQVFETLDDLLLAISPMYGERRAEALMSRLSQLAETPS